MTSPEDSPPTPLVRHQFDRLREQRRAVEGDALLVSLCRALGRVPIDYLWLAIAVHAASGDRSAGRLFERLIREGHQPAEAYAQAAAWSFARRGVLDGFSQVRDLLAVAGCEIPGDVHLAFLVGNGNRGNPGAAACEFDAALRAGQDAFRCFKLMVEAYIKCGLREDADRLVREAIGHPDISDSQVAELAGDIVRASLQLLDLEIAQLLIVEYQELGIALPMEVIEEAQATAISAPDPLSLSEKPHETSVELLGIILGMVVHELAQPITTLEQAAGLLSIWGSKECEGDEATTQLTNVQKLVAEDLRPALRKLKERLRMYRAISEVRMSQPDSGLNTTMAEVFDELQQMSSSDGGEILLHISTDESLNGIYFELDPFVLAFALRQLVRNASKALRGFGENPSVTVSSVLEPPLDGMVERVVIEVTDNGPGIPLPIQGMIAKRGFTTKGGGGMGLGLNLLLSVIHFYGGYVRLHSRPGCTTWTLTIPRARAAGDHYSTP